jgi:hypothetical protein
VSDAGPVKGHALQMLFVELRNHHIKLIITYA